MQPLEPGMIKVAVIDDHPIARRGVSQILVESGRIGVVASCASAGELPGALSDHGEEGRPDVVVLDLYHDGGMPCLDAVAELSRQTRVLVMSASGSPADVVGAVRAGAAGYVTKQSGPEVFVAAVETVAAGGFALSPRLADILHGELARPSAPGPSPSGPPQLSAREEEALGLIANGFTHAQVATRMGVSKATVDTYIERVRTKLQVGNKAELTRAALERRRPSGPV
ncbi:response regulator [Actinoallomurus soli]|uniref:response regulator n=1 Tax=Actinoallomurus soli TaxID=2952535 RepID=UPI0020929197|nr:response regulator transcription factor [Actinoallomurus soli]MCO5973965.1 response regulator transcription factor [Actinoallomurus soli]